MEEPTPSQNLSDPFAGLNLASQSQQVSSFQLKRAPIPLFSQANDQNQPPKDNAEVNVSQLDFLGTPDFITPADLFQLEYNPNNQDAKNQRSPAQLSPNRAKRPRGEGRILLLDLWKLKTGAIFLSLPN